MTKKWGATGGDIEIQAIRQYPAWRAKSVQGYIARGFMAGVVVGSLLTLLIAGRIHVSDLTPPSLPSVSPSPSSSTHVTKKNERSERGGKDGNIFTPE